MVWSWVSPFAGVGSGDLAPAKYFRECLERIKAGVYLP